MALIECPNCKNEVSDAAEKCPHCGHKLKEKKYKIFPKILIPIVIAIIGLGIFVGIKVQEEKQRAIEEQKRIEEQRRQEQIATLKKQAEEAYNIADFTTVESYYDELDNLGYDTSSQREILSYDKEVFPVAYDFHTKIKDADNKITNRSASSLNALIGTLKIPFSKMDNAKANSASKIGQYINDVKGNSMYYMFESEFINDTSKDLDNWLVKDGYYIVLQVYTNELADIEFPYIPEE